MLALLVAWGIYAGPLLDPNTNLYAVDTYCQDVPLRLYAANLIRHGEFPHWTPQVNCGYPLFADGQTGVLYPLFLLYLLWPNPEMHDIFMATHFLLLGSFMYLFLRARGLSPTAGLIGAVTSMAASFHQSNHVVPGCLATVTWLPLAMYLIQRGAQPRRLHCQFWCALVNAVMLLAGHVQASLICYSFEALWWLFIARPWRPASRLSGALVLFVLPLAMCAAQMLPTAAFLGESDRSSGLFDSQLAWSEFADAGLRWPLLLTFFAPDSAGRPEDWRISPGNSAGWEEALVVFHGYAAIALLPLGILRGRPRSEAYFWSLTLLLAVLVSMPSPFRWLMMHVPLHNLFRWPTRYMIVASYCAAVLVAFGAEIVVRHIERRCGATRPRASQCGKLAFVVACAAGIVLRGFAPYLIAADFYRTQSPQLVAASREPSHFRLLPLTSALFHAWMLDQEQYRRNAASLPVSYNLLFGVPVASVFDQGGAVGPQRMSDLLLTPHSVVLKIAAVTHLSAPLSVEDFLREPIAVAQPRPIPPREDLEQLASQPAYAYRYRQAFPRAWFVYRTRRLADSAARLRYLFSGRFDPAEEALVEDELGGFSAPQSPATVACKQINAARAEFEVRAPRRAFLVIADYYSPSIKATVDGAEVRLLRTNHAFSGIEVPAGEHRVVLAFRPRLFYLGLALSAAAAAICVGGIVLGRRRAWRD